MPTKKKKSAAKVAKKQPAAKKPAAKATKKKPAAKATKKPAAKQPAAKVANKPATVAAYLASLPPPTRALVDQARKAIAEAVPTATTDIAYGFIRFKVAGKMLIYIAGWKHHYALYPAYGSITQTFAKQLAAYEVVKDTIKFPLDEPVPTALIRDIARLRAAELTAAK